MISKRILIADENAGLRGVTCTFLESRMECRVCGEAVDGVDAIKEAGALNPNLSKIISRPSRQQFARATFFSARCDELAICSPPIPVACQLLATSNQTITKCSTSNIRPTTRAM